MRNLENSTLGKYEVLREIGRGSMGTVYLAHDPFADRRVAIKVAHPEAVQDDALGHRNRKLFFNEAKAAGMLRHPNIIAVYDAAVEDDIWYIVMEHIPGEESLHNYSRRDRLLPLSDVVRIIFTCARALDFAHRKGVIHRDIKPRNILLTREREVKIGDFGIALITRLDETATQVHGYLGSPLYMSPEQIIEETIGTQTDLFSLGVIMYEMLTGVHPFAADSLGEITRNITTVPHRPLRELRPDAPRVLEHILDRTLKKKQAGRYKTGIDLAADLSLVFEDVEATAQAISDSEKVALLRDLAFFREFSDSEIHEVVQAAVWYNFQPDDQIIAEGETDTSFYIIVGGEVCVRKAGVEVHKLKEGDCFGEMGYISKAPRSATIIAKNTVTVLRVKPSLIERASINAQLRFHKVFLHTMVERLSAVTEMLAREKTASGPR